MFDAIITYSGFTLFGLATLCFLVQGLRACRKYRSWLPLPITIGLLLGITLLGFVLGLLLRPWFT